MKLKLTFGVLVVVAGFLLTRIGLFIKDSADRASRIRGESTVIPEEESILTQDTDNDGLSDYNEVIYATKFDEPDTDGDGYLDGEEIVSGFDPLDPDSNSRVSQPNLGAPRTANLTDRLLNLGVASLIDDTGEFFDPNLIDDRAYADILNSINIEGALSLFVPPVSDADIKISEDNSLEAIKKYLNSTSATVEVALLSSNGGIFSGLNQIASPNSNYSNYYLNGFYSLKTIEVPSSWLEIHRSTLTSLLQLAKAFQAMQNLEEDPVKASLALNQIQETFFNIQLILNQASKLAKSQNVSVSNSIIEMLQSLDPTTISP